MQGKTLAIDPGRLSNLQEIILLETEDFAKVIAFSNASQVLASAHESRAVSSNSNSPSGSFIFFQDLNISL